MLLLDPEQPTVLESESHRELMVISEDARRFFSAGDDIRAARLLDAKAALRSILGFSVPPTMVDEDDLIMLLNYFAQKMLMMRRRMPHQHLAAEVEPALFLGLTKIYRLLVGRTFGVFPVDSNFSSFIRSIVSASTISASALDDSNEVYDFYRDQSYQEAWQSWPALIAASAIPSQRAMVRKLLAAGEILTSVTEVKLNCGEDPNMYAQQVICRLLRVHDSLVEHSFARWPEGVSLAA